MANIYVSKTATNGYAVGLDSRTKANAASKTTPVLTLTRALAVAEAGDTIILNDGTYAEAAYLEISKANLTINAENDYLVTVQSPGTSFTMLQYVGGTGLTLGKIVIDATNIATYSFCQSGAPAVTINGTHFINFTGIGVGGSSSAGLTMFGGWLIESLESTSAGIQGINITMGNAGTCVINDGEINLFATNGTVTAMNLTASVSDCILNVENNTITVGSGNSAKSITCIKVSGLTEITIENNEITETTLQNSSGSYEGIFIPNSAITAKKCWILNNTFNGGNPSPATNANGHNILIGDDVTAAPTNHDNINGIWIKGNICTNMNHMIIIAWVTRGVVQGNKCTNGVIGVIGKHTTNCLFSGNVLIGIQGGGALRSKGGTGDIYTNNTVIMTTLSTTVGLGILNTDASTGVVFKNNIFYMYDIAAKFVSVQDTAVATFFNNNYYSVVGCAANPFAYGATNYADLAAWIAAKEASALNVDPDFVDYANSDYRVPVSNTDLYHKGVYAGANARDYRLRPFFVTPTIGAYEINAGRKSATRKPRVV